MKKGRKGGVMTKEETNKIWQDGYNEGYKGGYNKGRSNGIDEERDATADQRDWDAETRR